MYSAVSSPAVYTEVSVVRMSIKFAFRQKQSGPTEDYRFVMALGKVSISKICHIKFGIFPPPTTHFPECNLKPSILWQPYLIKWSSSPLLALKTRDEAQMLIALWVSRATFCTYISVRLENLLRVNLIACVRSGSQLLSNPTSRFKIYILWDSCSCMFACSESECLLDRD